MEWLKIFNKDYANAISALTPFVIGVVSWFYYKIYKENQSKTQNTVYIRPVFWSLREEYRIDTLKRFKLTDDRKNYAEIETLYTPESWGEFITINRRFLRTRIVPKNDNDILVLTIKRQPHENWKIIYFNR
jgi:hypothetical protein